MIENKLEKDVLVQIKSINESFLGAIAKLFMSSKMKRHYKKAYKIAKHDPELQAAMADLEDYHGRLNKIIKTLCKRNPNHPKCD